MCVHIAGETFAQFLPIEKIHTGVPNLNVSGFSTMKPMGMFYSKFQFRLNYLPIRYRACVYEKRCVRLSCA